MNHYHCWIPGWEDDEDGSSVPAYSADDAAQDYCDKRYCDVGSSWPGEVCVHVRGDGELTQFAVTIDWSPSFHATAMKHGPRKPYEWERAKEEISV